MDIAVKASDIVCATFRIILVMLIVDYWGFDVKQDRNPEFQSKGGSSQGSKSMQRRLVFGYMVHKLRCTLAGLIHSNS